MACPCPVARGAVDEARGVVQVVQVVDEDLRIAAVGPRGVVGVVGVGVAEGQAHGPLADFLGEEDGAGEVAAGAVDAAAGAEAGDQGHDPDADDHDGQGGLDEGKAAAVGGVCGSSAPFVVLCGGTGASMSQSSTRDLQSRRIAFLT